MSGFPLKPFLLLIFTLFFFNAQSQTRVVLRVLRSTQPDTLGCNFVEELTRIVYNEILSGHLKLWDSPEKEIQITGASLQEIERSSGVKFTQQEAVYVYEYWSNSARSLRSFTQGFSFSVKNQVGEDVSFGYVDYKESPEVFLKNVVNSNANGKYNVSIADYIIAKDYAFDLLQFGGEVVKGVKESQKIKQDFIGTNTFNKADIIRTEQQKMVYYYIDFDNSADSKKLLSGRQLMNAIRNYLADNKEMFYNLGGDKIGAHAEDKWKLTAISVKEIWKKADYVLTSIPVSVILYVNDSALNEIPYRDMIKMDIEVNGKGWMELLKEKNFRLTINRINAQTIVPAEAYQYLKALQTAEWNKVIEYVEANKKY